MGMALSEDGGPAPYAAASAVIKLLETYRDTGFTTPFTTANLGRLGFESIVAQRVLQATRLLDLTDEEGNPTKNLLDFKQAGHDTYKAVFAGILRQAYAPIFAVTGQDPSQRTRQQISDAFRRHTPDSGRRRIVNLFLGLCAYAEIIAEIPGEKPGPKVRTVSVPRRLVPAAKPPRHETTALPSETPAVVGSTISTDLRSGGKVTLTVSVDVIDLSTDDRKYVFDLIDKIKGYGVQPALTPGDGTGRWPTGTEDALRVQTGDPNSSS